MRVKFPPIDQIYLPHHVQIHNNRDRYLILYGGRGGAKSTDTAKKLVIRCLTEPYFRYILLRKTYVSIKDSQYAAIQKIVKEWGLQPLFQFVKSPLEIRCFNGNKFIARGLDKQDATKSIDEPTGIWYEEANQIGEADFIASTTSIRTPMATYLQEILTLNPECDGEYLEFWLYKKFFEGQTDKSFKGSTTIEYANDDGTTETVESTYTVIHSTYKGNPYLPKDYIANLLAIRETNPHYFRVFTLGLWGNKENDSPFIITYDPEKHDGHPVRNNNEIFYFSFDFNKNPMCCSVIQHYDGQVRVLEVIKLANSSIYEVCEYIKLHYGGTIKMVTGDATGKNRSALVKGNIHFYSVIMKELGLTSHQIKVPNTNPRIEANGLMVNAVLANYPVVIHKERARALIYDFKNVRKRADGTIEKRDRDNPAMQADALDTFRYWCNVFMINLIKM